jgi:hypothetical protein
MNEDIGLRIIGCPQCGAPAEAVSEGRLGGTGGRVELVRVRCAERHCFLMTEDRLPVPRQRSSSEARTSPSPRATSRRPPGPSGTQPPA